MVGAAIIATVLLGACGTDVSPELVVGDAAAGGGVPALLGAKPGAVYWTVAAGTGPKRIAGASLVDLPGEAQELGMASGPIAHVGDHVVFASGETILRADVTSGPAKVATVTAEALGESPEADPVLVWTAGAVVSWGNGDVMGSATLPKVVRCDHLEVTASNIYIAAEGTSERRLLRLDRKTGTVFPLTGSKSYSAAFPGGGPSDAVYRGRIVGTDDLGALWLVEETPAGATSPARAILVSVPDEGEESVLLEHITEASAFFTTDDGFYWQERDALLTAPRSGGAASIAGHLPGTAGAIDSGFIYFVDGAAIERLPLDALD